MDTLDKETVHDLDRMDQEDTDLFYHTALNNIQSESLWIVYIWKFQLNILHHRFLKPQKINPKERGTPEILGCLKWRKNREWGDGSEDMKSKQMLEGNEK